MMTAATVCTHCLAQLADWTNHLDVRPAGDDPAEMAIQLYEKTKSVSLAARKSLIEEAFTAGRRVEINGCGVEPAVTTWRGDPVCPSHLAFLAARDREPLTVRMAQWRR